MLQACVRRILLVEDNLQLLTVLSKFLRRAGYDVTQACSSGAALQAYTDQPAALDLVITDVHLGDGSGIQLAHSLRLMNAAQPVILMSGDMNGAEALDELGTSAAGYLAKPFTLPDLALAIRTAFSRADVVSAMRTVGKAAPDSTAPESAWCILPADLLKMADEHSGAGAGHSTRVGQIARMAAILGGGNMTGRQLNLLGAAACCHELVRMAELKESVRRRSERSEAFLRSTGVPEQVARLIAYSQLRLAGRSCELPAQSARISQEQAPVATSELLDALTVADFLDHTISSRVLDGVSVGSAIQYAADALNGSNAPFWAATSPLVEMASEIAHQVWNDDTQASRAA